MKSISEYFADMDKQRSDNVEEDQEEEDVTAPSEDKANKSSSSEESEGWLWD